MEESALTDVSSYIQFNLLNTVNVRSIATQVIIIVGNVRVH